MHEVTELSHDLDDRLVRFRAVRRELEASVLPPDDLSGIGLRTQVPIRYAQGFGTVLEGDRAAFHDAVVRPAAPEEVRGWLERIRSRRAQLAIGELATAPGVDFALDAGGFNRHTFLCGQSGSVMRLNSLADAAFAQAVFSFVPVIRFGSRIAEEGGADAPTTWARRAS
jgi:hypothetical protein